MELKKTFQSKAEPASTFLQPCEAEGVWWDMQQIQLAIARRAYELFESSNREHGHDWEDWFRAESELLRPVSIAVSESPDRISIRANVLGFEADELKVSLEPKRIVILGRKEISATEAEAPRADFYPDLILRTIEISSEVDPTNSVIELQSGILKFELPKVAPGARAAVAVGKA